VENCIVESEITNYKDPMVEKPTFPYKRKNHFCEWTVQNCSSKLILKRLANVKQIRQ
jgi:mannosyltransferase OCH1-like enzyme